jgi:3',5'-cyclic-AMP phosphodiesterase
MTGPETMRQKISTHRPLAFAHIGDLHITDAKQRNFLDFTAIVAQIEIECAGMIDFVVLPGDHADNGRPDQYRLIATALKMLSPPVHLIAGDHDMEQGSLEAFYDGLTAERLPKAVSVRGVRCLFLDINGPGKGGPDFRLGVDQMQWLERELRNVDERGETAALFMHSYPDDLKGDGETAVLNGLIDAHNVALVDMGHTHYNELANDGRTIFAATRSTGQIEEGPVGYSFATIDSGVVSWRFKALDDPFPFVIITAPTDHRLMRGLDQTITGKTEVRAMVFGARSIQNVDCRIGDAWVEMRRSPEDNLWVASLTFPAEPLVPLTARAVDESGRPGQHTIVVATRIYTAAVRSRNGSDAASIGAWPENGIPGTQLGPNRNGKPIS